MIKQTEEFMKVYENMKEDDALKQEKAVMVYAIMQSWDISEDCAKKMLETIQNSNLDSKSSMDTIYAESHVISG